MSCSSPGKRSRTRSVGWLPVQKQVMRVSSTRDGRTDGGIHADLYKRANNDDVAQAGRAGGDVVTMHSSMHET